MRFLLTAVFCLLLPVPSSAQSENGIFESYDALRTRMDGLMMQRQIRDLMIAFGGADEISSEELTSLQNQVMDIYPQDFTQADVIRVDQMANGWRQELIAYWTAGTTDFIFVRVLIHDRHTQVIAAEFDFNSNFREIILLF